MTIRICIDCNMERAQYTSKRCRPCSKIRSKLLMKISGARYANQHLDQKRASFRKYYQANKLQMIERRAKYYAENKEQESLKSAARRLANRDKILVNEKALRASIPERFQKYRKTDYTKNRDKILAHGRAYKAANREKLNAKSAEYCRNHPELYRYHQAKRRAAEKRATPAWADQTKIMKFYEEAVRLTRETGIRHEVDHIYPLQSKICCGLHCEFNLQILTAQVNRSKKNRLPEHIGMALPTTGVSACL